jgi:hypothetical protein
MLKQEIRRVLDEKYNRFRVYDVNLLYPVMMSHFSFRYIMHNMGFYYFPVIRYHLQLNEIEDNLKYQQFSEAYLLRETVNFNVNFNIVLNFI